MARGAQAMAASGQVFVPNNSVGDRFIEDCTKFPASKDDHRVDAFVNLCLRLEFIWEAQAPKTVTEERPIFSTNEIKISKLMPPRMNKKDNRWKRKFGKPNALYER